MREKGVCLRILSSGSLADMVQTASDGIACLSIRTIAIEDAMIKSMRPSDAFPAEKAECKKCWNLQAGRTCLATDVRIAETGFGIFCVWNVPDLCPWFVKLAANASFDVSHEVLVASRELQGSGMYKHDPFLPQLPQLPQPGIAGEWSSTRALQYESPELSWGGSPEKESCDPCHPPSPSPSSPAPFTRSGQQSPHIFLMFSFVSQSLCLDTSEHQNSWTPLGLLLDRRSPRLWSRESLLNKHVEI